jgi:hypothetical protein
MSSISLHSLQSYPVTVNGLTLLLSGWQAVGSCVLREEGTAEGNAALTSAYPKGTRLTLRGKLTPVTTGVRAAAAFAEMLQNGTVQDVTVQTLCFPAARLCGYTVREEQELPEAVLVFFVSDTPVLTEKGE